MYASGQTFRPDLGNKPFQAAVDPDAEAKIRQNGSYDPFNNHMDCLKLLIRGTLKYGALRGSSEVSLIVSFFFIINLDGTHLAFFLH